VYEIYDNYCDRNIDVRKTGIWLKYGSERFIYENGDEYRSE
jgi:hypothetical protein